MSLYLGVLKKMFLQQFMYRANIVTNLIGGIIGIVIQISIWQNLIGINGKINNINLPDMITFTVISLVVRKLTSSSIAYVLADKVKSGAIALDLIKPINIKAYLFSEQTSENIYNFIFSSIPILIITIAFWDFKLNKDIIQLLFFLTALLLSYLLMYLIDYTLGLLVFWIKNGTYIDLLSSGLFKIFSGAFIPLWFYPGFLQDIAKLLPFRLVVFEPIAIYLGKVNYYQAINIILLQLFWIGIFFMIENIIWKYAQKMIFIQGG